MIKKCDDKWCLYTKDGSKLLGKHDTEEQAQAQERAIEASKHKYAAELKAREVFRVGTHNGDKYVEKDLDDMVAAFNELDFSPAIKIGHAQSGSEAYGYIENLRRNGDRLIADFTHLDDTTKQKIDDRKLARVSGEVYFNFKRNGKTYPRVLGAVALLGHEIPGVAGLKPLYENYSAKDGVEFRTYEFEFPTGDNQRGNADQSNANEENEMAKTIEEVQAELAALRANYDAQQTQLKTYAEDQTKLATYKAESELLKTEVNRLRDAQVKRTVDEKVETLKIPALRDSFKSLYAMAIEKPSKVKHYSASDKKETEVDVSDLLDQMVSHLNDKIAPMLKSYSKHDEAKAEVEADNAVDAGKEVDKLVRDHIAKNEVDYATALTAVLKENTELAKVYATN